MFERMMRGLMVTGILGALLAVPALQAKKEKNPEEPNVVKLENLGWKPMWTTHMGCLKGCLEYLGMDVSDAWLFGATGHAFVINIHERVAASGPTLWNTEKLFELGSNLGYQITGVKGESTDSNFVEKQKEAWDMVRGAIDQGYPCYGWCLNIPDYYVINGYDDVGYYYSGPMSKDFKMPLSWQELGKQEVQVLEAYVVKPGKPADDRTTVREALEFAIEISKSPERWTFPEFKTGLAGYDNWIRAMESDPVNVCCNFGVVYNAEVWSECRTYAVEFLKEAKLRLADSNLDPLFDEAISHYEVVVSELGKVKEQFPFLESDPEHIKDPVRREKAVTALKAAREAEAKGLETLAKIVEVL
jgi:hypothetical protein